jgi:hypothetical protein
MYITNEDLDALKEGLHDLNSENRRKKNQASLQRLDYYDRILHKGTTRRKSTSTKDGRRFSSETSKALDQHVAEIRSVARKAENMAGELMEHSRTLHQKANDLTALYRSEGQGPAFATD